MIKKIKIVVLIIMTLISVNVSTIKAEQAGGVNNSGNQGTDGSSEGTSWKWDYLGEKYYNGLKVSLYNKNGNYLQTVAFLNDESEEKKLNSEEVWVRDDIRRLDNVVKNGTWSDASSTYFKYLNYPDFFRTNTNMTILDFFGTATEQELIEKLNLTDISDDWRDIVVIIEPAIVLNNRNSSKSKKGSHFGTYWEFRYLYDTTKGVENEFRWVLGSVVKDLGDNISITKGTINDDLPIIKEFLNLDNFTAFRNEGLSNDLPGVAIVALEDIITIEPDKKYCTTTINNGNCSEDFKLSDPTDRECIVSAEDTYFEDNYLECGNIYCSYEINTKLNGFYNSFSSIAPIRSGSYFDMNSVELDVTKTCYFEAVSTAVSCKTWYNGIKDEKKNAGVIKLNLAGHEYVLNDKSTYDKTYNNAVASCVSNDSNGFCTKASLSQKLEFVLNPTVNRYISIKDMAGTATAPGSDVKDLGGPKLTTPISLSTGKHNYTLDFQGANIFKDYINKINNIPQDSIVKNNKQLELIYNFDEDYDSKLNNLSYSCQYETNNNTDPNCVCADECCDNECKPIPCEDPIPEPGGFPNVIYRPINLEDAFPGEDGTGRDYGSNWKDYVYDEGGNVITKPNGTPYTKEEYYINFNRGYDDYEVYRAEPLYVIKLDYDTMKAIRKYNDDTNHDYNDFTLTCDNGENCISNFLRGNVKGFNINLIHSGTCKTINHSTFNSCISRLGA